MARRSSPSSASSSENRAHRLQAAVEELAGNVRILTDIVDQIREDLSWLTRNGIPHQPLVEHVQRMPLVTAEEGNGRSFEFSLLSLPARDPTAETISDDQLRSAVIDQIVDRLEEPLGQLAQKQLNPLLSVLDDSHRVLLKAIRQWALFPLLIHCRSRLRKAGLRSGVSQGARDCREPSCEHRCFRIGLGDKWRFRHNCHGLIARTLESLACTELVMKPRAFAGIIFGLCTFGSSLVWIDASEPFRTLERSGAAGSQFNVDSTADETSASQSNRAVPEDVNASEHDSAFAQAVDSSNRRRELRRAAAFADFHKRQRTEFGSINPQFGFRRMTEMRMAQSMSHAVLDRTKLLKLRETDNGASVSRIRPKSLGNSSGGFQDDQNFVVPMPPFLRGDEFLSITGFNAASSDRIISVTAWEVVRFDLIGLVKHPTPVAYVSKTIPRMEELNNLPTVPLNAFERNAIDQFRSNPKQDVVIHNSANQIELVGALRAEKVCAHCHSVQAGELLGALTYCFILNDEMDSEISSEEDEWKRAFLARVTQHWQSVEMPFSRRGSIRIATEASRLLTQIPRIYRLDFEEDQDSLQIHYPAIDAVE